ncbi:MAG: hypothetical protein ACOX8Q_09485 [Christensenellales bacterium]|jgi:hypothetical protein
MKKLAFVLGYAGGILALIFSLFMIYTVPAGILSDTIENIKDNMKNEHVLAFNEMALAATDAENLDYSNQGLAAFADEVAQRSVVVNDREVYEKTAAFIYKTGLHGMVSMGIVGMTIVFALVGFIGALVCRKAPNAGAVMMFIAALFILLSAIYTNTVVPMIFASLLFTVSGIAVFIPKHLGKPYYKAQYVQPYYPPNYYSQHTYPLQPQERYSQPKQESYPKPARQESASAIQKPPVTDIQQAQIPFPDEEAQVLVQPINEDNMRD